MKFSIGSLAVNTLVLFLLTSVCFYLYAGFKNIYLTITYDNIPGYVGVRYMLSHPSFIIASDYPHFYPLSYLYVGVVQMITHDTHWLSVMVSLFLHVINAFILFKISQILCKNRLFPSIVASLFFLDSYVHMDNLLSFPHSYPVISSFFGLLSLYFFFKAIEKKDYIRLQLFLAFILYLVSISCSENFIGLPVFYFLIMLFRIKQFKKDFIYALLIVISFFSIRFLLQKVLMDLYKVDYQGEFVISLKYLIDKIKHYPYSFFYLISQFFHSFTLAFANFFNKTEFVLANAHKYDGIYFRNCFSIFIICIPLVFLNKQKMLKLYSLLILMYLLFFPYYFSPVPLADRHITQTIVASSLFIGLLIYYLFESLGKIKIKLLKKILQMTMVILVGGFFFKHLIIIKYGVKQYIACQVSFTPNIEKFVQEFKKVKVPNVKKQIYFLKNEIPKEYSFLNNATTHCYYIFYLAVKYKKLSPDFYSFIFSEAQCGRPIDEERCRNYFISLSDGSCYGFFRDKRKLLKLINDNPDLSLKDVVVLDWQDGLKQENFEQW